MTPLTPHVRHQLPAEMTSFVGRRSDVAAIRRIAAHSRLVTLTGFGGLGKTRLALRAAYEMRRAFRDGVCVVELAPLSSPELLPYAMLDALGMRRRSNDPLDQLCSELSDRNLLIVLDNCEHLINAAADLAEALLAAVPGLTILATSRQPLRIAGEYLYPVAPLPLPGAEGDYTPGTAMQYPAVALLAERAAACVPDFALTPQNEASLIRLCRQLDGIPLAIELAASRLQVLEIDQLTERLKDRSLILREQSRNFPERHRTLEALIEWSHDLCTPTERLLWARASTFAGDFSLDALEAICTDEALPTSAVIDTLGTLVDRSIVLREVHGDHVRFRMLDTIREYGRARLAESGQADRFARRHRDWYADLIFRAGQEWTGPAQAAWAQRLRDEHPNIRSALEFSISSPGDTEITFQMVAVTWFWMAMEYHHEGRLWLARALDAPAPPTHYHAWALGTDAYLAVFQGDMSAAEQRANELQEMAEILDDDSARGFAAHMFALQRGAGPDPASSLPLMRRALALYSTDVEPQHIDNLLIELATGFIFIDDLDSAREIIDDLFDRSHGTGDRWLFSYALWGRGFLAILENRPDEAKTLLTQSLRIKREFQETLGIALVCELLAWAEAGDNNSSHAAMLLGIADTFWSVVGISQLHALREHYEALVRAQMGAEACEAAMAHGATLSRDAAISFALGETTGSSPEQEPSAPILTARQREVAQMVAEGLQNKEIAARLVISLRTAEGHVEAILSKLGFSTRTQIAAWVHQQEQRRGREYSTIN